MLISLIEQTPYNYKLIDSDFEIDVCIDWKMRFEDRIVLLKEYLNRNLDVITNLAIYEIQMQNEMTGVHFIK